MQKNPPQVEFRRSPMATPLPPAIRAMVERADSVSSASAQALVSASQSH